MKRLRGLRLGRKLVRICSRVVCRRRSRRGYAYIRLGAASDSPTPVANRAIGGSYRWPSVTGKLFGWGWNICRRPFSRSSGWFRRIPHGAGGWEGRCDRGVSAATAKMLAFGEQHQRTSHHALKAPKGHLVVYVGKGGPDGVPPPHRVVVPVIYFNHPLFGELLREAEQEYGFHHPGGITIPCPISDFESVRDRVAASASASDLHVRTASGRIWRWH